MSKMTHKRKCEIVEALKVNERGYGFLSDEEKEVLQDAWMNSDNILCLHSGGVIWQNAIAVRRPTFIYRVKQSYTVPIEPPEGYRLVTDEERGKYDKPEVFSCFDIRPSSASWLVEKNGCFPEWYDTHAYAVPLAFSFEPKTIEINGKTVTKEELGDAVWNAIIESTK